MKVSELAERAGSTATTIRFYESEGVLPSAPRQDNGYRDYGEDDVCRLRLVVALRGLGLDLAECGRLAELCCTGHCDDMADDLAVRVAERRSAIALAMAELRHLDTALGAVEHALVGGQAQATFCLSPAAIASGGPR